MDFQLYVLLSYFNNLTHRTKIKECFSNRLKIEYGVPQGSILSPLLFNINSIDMFYEFEDYADDTTPYACASVINTVTSKLQITASKLFIWFHNNPTLKKATFFKFQNYKKDYFC